MFYWSKDIGVYEGNRQPGSIELVGLPPSPYHTPQILDGQHIGWGIDDNNFAKLQAEMQQQLETAVDDFMDGKARAKGFRDRHSFALRAGIPGSSWHAQALVFGAWMDAVNDYCWQVRLDCLEGKREVPTVDELLAELPGLTL